MAHDDNAAPDEPAAAEVTAGDWGDALRASEQRFWRDFGRAPLGLLVTSLTADRRCACLTVNETYCELTGYTRGELGGGDFLSCFHPEDQPALEILIQDVISGATDQIGADARLVRIDGEIVWAHLTGSVIRQPPASDISRSSSRTPPLPNSCEPRYSGSSASCSGRSAWRASGSSWAGSHTTSATRSR